MLPFSSPQLTSAAVATARQHNIATPWISSKPYGKKVVGMCAHAHRAQHFANSLQRRPRRLQVGRCQGGRPARELSRPLPHGSYVVSLPFGGFALNSYSCRALAERPRPKLVCQRRQRRRCANRSGPNKGRKAQTERGGRRCYAPSNGSTGSRSRKHQRESDAVGGEGEGR